ncbi:MAG: ParA family protein [Nevskia sp.]|nr:ParA family protein [Nevskia sp.]
MKTLAVYNVKGGVGKTATSINLAYLAAQSGRSTLLWDLDPQAAATWYLQAKGGEGPGKAQWKAGSELRALIQPTPYENLHLLPAGLDNRHLDVWLRKDDARDALAQRLESVAGDYDLAILDCPPSLSHLADNIFTAADLVLVPVVPTHLSLRALKALIDYFREESYPRSRLKPFYSMADRRRLLHRTLIEQPPKTMRDVCRAVIPYTSAVERMGEHRAPVEAFEASAPAAEAYRELWKEVNAALRGR